MDPIEAIAIIENDLRLLVHATLSREVGPGWADEAFGEAMLTQLQARADEEARRRRPAAVSTDPLQYTHLGELRRVIEKAAYWPHFLGALGEKKTFTVYMDAVMDYRNAPAHSRTLLQYEKDLLTGIAGWVRTRVTISRSSRDANQEYYPLIEKITDSFGTEWTNENGKTDHSIVSTGIALHVGQEVVFSCSGWDPQGRELKWSIATFISPSMEAVGAEADLQWVVAGTDVRDHQYVDISVTSSGEYHRYGSHDQRVSFEYRVLPPL